MPPPSSGGLAIAQMLGILEAMPDWQQIGAQKPVRNDVGYEPTPFAAHLFSEAGRLAYRARYVADPDFAPLPGGSWASLTDKAYLGSARGWSARPAWASRSPARRRARRSRSPTIEAPNCRPRPTSRSSTATATRCR
jgi:gamma-glutamyltranspeptidase